MATVIQIKRSAGNTGPTAAQLSEGEMAYAQDASNDGTSAKLYIESVDSAGAPDIHAVGGKFYTDLTDANAADLAAATAAKTANELARRDANGAISADLTGDVTGNVSGTAASWATARTITLQGDVTGTIQLDGSGDVTSSALSVTGAEATELAGDVKAGDGTVVLENGTDGTDATLIADILANDGTVVLSNGTDGTDATFAGDVTGDLTGDVTGDLTGDVTGDLTGNVTGNVTGDLTGNASTATALATARTIEISGDGSGSASFDGTGDIDINYTLADTGVVAGQVGSTSQVPVLDIDSKGRVLSIGTAAIETSFTVGADSGTDDLVAGGETLNFVGTSGEIETAVTNNQIQIGLPTDVSVAGTMGVGGKLTVTGDLEVNGSLTTVNSTDLEVVDGLIRLGKGNAGDLLDLGFVSQFNDGTDKYTGLFRDANDDKYHLFETQEDLATAQSVNKLGTGYSVATMVANLEGDVIGSLSGGTVAGLSAAINVADGGTGAATHTPNGVLLGNGAGPLVATAQGQDGHVLMADQNGLPSFQPIDGGTF